MPTRPTPPFAELAASTAFSFLHAASQPEEMVARAAELGFVALGIADRNTVAGVVRAHQAAKQAGLRLLPGSRLCFVDDTPDLRAYPTDRTAWGRLTCLLTVGKQRAKKGDCVLRRADLLDHAGGMILLALPPELPDSRFAARFGELRAALGRQVRVAAFCRLDAHDPLRLEMAAAIDPGFVATNDPLYHVTERRPLQDVLTAIRLGTTVLAAGRLLAVNAERHMKSPATMARLFSSHLAAIARTIDIADRCRFSLDDLRYEYPDEPVPEGVTPDAHLAALAWAGAAQRYPAGIPQQVRAAVEKELALIGKLDYARYFLTVHDIVRFARTQGILCQGRGSAANSAVCYCLGITAVDPAEIDLLFERFVSSERREPPDIDVDFEHERREEVIQYIYRRYGRDRAGIAATVIHYRPKLAIRDVGKALGLAEDAIAALSAQSWASSRNLWSAERLQEIGFDPADSALGRAVALARELVGFPRHLSQHVGGFVLTRGRLDQVVPIGPAAMPGRSFIEWDKDDIDALGIMKVDVLALGMLTCIRKCFALLQQGGIPVADLADVPRDDPAVWQMLQAGDSIGVFQVESRAQMNMLPRLRPARFYDLVIQVAIVRPGPIQGDMVHPYLRRRQGKEPVHFPSPAPEHGTADELSRVLGRTLGVPLFQEQAMRIAIDAARFTPEEANALRRAMATFRNTGTIHRFSTKMIEGMVARGYQRDFAERCFRQIEGFGTYGFPESHAASFAHLVYVSAWLKCRHPAAFACALLNAQPMGFYAPAQIVRDAREHGVAVRPVDISGSGWDCTLESGPALRLGLRMIEGFREEWANALRAILARHRDLATLARRLPRSAIILLAEADAMRSIGLDRRTALWHARGLPEAELPPLLAALAPPLGTAELPRMALPEHVVADYQMTGLSLKAHPLRFLRTTLRHEGIVTCAEAAERRDGARLAVAGLVLVRQRPGSAAGVVFVTIEDETGIVNIVVWPAVTERDRRALLGSSLLLVRGKVQRSPEGIVHVIAERLIDRSAALLQLDSATFPAPLARADEVKHPQSPRTRPLLRSRDFH